jgi:hypothetical protein
MASQAQKTLPFGPWRPDLSSIAQSDAAVILNVYPRNDGYGPFNSLQAFTNALPAACRGFFFARRSDGSIAVFAGTITDLYLLDNTTFNWVRVSKGGVSYSPLVSSSNWSFAQFNDLVIVVQVNTAPQKYTLASGGNFADLGGSPPSAGFVSIVGFFVVLSALLSNPRRVQWSDLGAPETWTAGVGLADFQDMSDGGNVINLSGGDAFGVIFQQESIRSITYAPGSAVVFQIARISTQETLFADNSIINVGNRTFYCGAAGFKMIVGSGDPEPIGKEKFDRFFFGDVDRGNLQLVIGASDPTSTRVYWAYKSQSGSATVFDKVIVYDYALKEPTLLSVTGQFIGSLAKPGLTLEQLDAIAPGALTVLGAANNGSGLIRLTLNAVSTPQFMIAGQNFIVVQGVVGTTEANGTWVVNIIDPTHIDLVGSTFTHAYVSGGAIGGSLDDLPFSLDSISKSSAAQLGAFDTLNRLGFFNGPSLEAVLETGDGDPVGNTVEINGVRPITDCATAMCSVGTRMSASDPVVYSPEIVVDDQGWSEAYVETRYARGRARMPAGAAWSFGTGVQPDVAIAGDA